MSALSDIPTLLVAGATGAGKTTLIRRLLRERPAAERWAVLVNDGGGTTIEPSEHVVVAIVAGGCVCCSAQVALRVGLTRLLREARPARLFVELNAASHLAEVRRTLASPWLAPVLRLGPIVRVARAGGTARGGEDGVLDVAGAARDRATLAALTGGS